MPNHSKYAVLFFSFLLIYLSVHSLTAGTKKAGVDFQSSNLPIVVINTHGQTIPKDNPRIIADMGIIWTPGQRNALTDSFNNYSGKISIEIHGQSSAGWDKKSYALETENPDGSNRDVSLLGLPKENDWILYAPFYDRSLLRNVLVYRLAREMGWYASRTRYCELVLNGSYQGLYVLMEKIKRDKHRVAINKLKPDEISGDDVTGGYILRIDKEPWKPGFDSSYPPFPGAQAGIVYQYVYPKPDNIVLQQKRYIQTFVRTFEKFMHDSLTATSFDRLSHYLNVNSFVDYFILNEFSRNVDGYRLSAYFYKDKDSKGGQLTAGPVWDYNFSFGNVDYYDSWKTAGWQLLYFAHDSYFHRTDRFFMPFWWETLFRNPSFCRKLNQRWTSLRQSILSTDSLFATINLFVDSLAEARARNFAIWPGPGEANLGGGWYPGAPPGMFVSNYAEEIAYLKQWMAARLAWMDAQIPLLAAVSAPQKPSLPQTCALQQNYPNPFNPVTTIAYRLSARRFVRLAVFNARGQRVRTLVRQIQAPGEHRVLFNARRLPSGVYVYRLQIGGNWVDAKKMIVLK